MKQTLSILRVGLIALASCSDQAPFVEVRSTKPRIVAPNVSPADREQLVGGNSAFAFQLYAALPSSGNLIYSPYSISQALATADAGANGETAEQMASALHFTLPPDRLHPAFNELDSELSHRVASQENNGFRLHVVNALWADARQTIAPSFLDLLAENYGAGLRLVDFFRDAEGARQAINSWVSAETEKKIQTLLDKGSVDSSTRFVLTNAVYFKAIWKSPFAAQETERSDFHRLDGSSVVASLMHKNEELLYARGDGFAAVRLPYNGDQLSMLLLVPDAGQFATVQTALSADGLGTIWRTLSTTEVQLALPKFTVKSSVGLVAALAKLGMVDAFQDGLADFAGIDGQRDLRLNGVLHKAYISVDEAGTEAAAATGAVGGVTTIPVQKATVTVDRPFLFAIVDDATQTLLFIGRVLDPTAAE